MFEFTLMKIAMTGKEGIGSGSGSGRQKRGVQALKPGSRMQAPSLVPNVLFLPLSIQVAFHVRSEDGGARNRPACPRLCVGVRQQSDVPDLPECLCRPRCCSRLRPPFLPRLPRLHNQLEPVLWHLSSLSSSWMFHWDWLSLQASAQYPG